MAYGRSEAEQALADEPIVRSAKQAGREAGYSGLREAACPWPACDWRNGYWHDGYAEGARELAEDMAE